MKRRSFLQLLSAWVTGAASRLYAAKSAIPAAIGQLQSAPPRAPAAKAPAKAAPRVRLVDVAAGKRVHLGSRGSRNYYVSVDDMAEENCFAFGIPTRNALVISAYNGGRQGALQSAVLSKLKELSPHDYESLDAAFNSEERMQPDQVFSFDLKIPSLNRASFPVDCLIVAVFEAVSSESEGFEWVEKAFGIAAAKRADCLIVPCLGRDWHDKNTIGFDGFYASFLSRVPADSAVPSVHFSFYGQWPSFELGDAVKSLNAKWKRA